MTQKFRRLTVAVEARFVEGAPEGLAGALAGHLDQAEIADAIDMKGRHGDTAKPEPNGRPKA